MRTLVVKTGATGDVVRTTILLRVLQGEIHWITSEYNAVILPELPNLHIHICEKLSADFFDLHFDRVINLEEDAELALILKRLSADEYVGPYVQDGKLTYTANSSRWFDMSLISRFGPAEANRLKLANGASYQECICEMLGITFQGEKYFVRPTSNESASPFLFGIEERVGKRWPNKQWAAFAQLRHHFNDAQIRFTDLDSRTSLLDYMRDINGVSVVISGDTLAMHLAIAYGKPCIGIFTCTSAAEIYDYGLLRKIISSRLQEFFYGTSYNIQATEAVRVEEVWNEVKKLLPPSQP